MEIGVIVYAEDIADAYYSDEDQRVAIIGEDGFGTVSLKKRKYGLLFQRKVKKSVESLSIDCSETGDWLNLVAAAKEFSKQQYIKENKERTSYTRRIVTALCKRVANIQYR